MRQLSQEELERLALFALGVFAGLVLVNVAAGLVDEWVVASDLADRRRIREIVREELARRAHQETAAARAAAAELSQGPEELARPAAEPQAAELPQGREELATVPLA